jgi:hypothetical protein
MRTLILGDNQLTGIHLWLDEGLEDDVDTAVSSAHKSKLLFPNLIALDVSSNSIREIPNVIHELSNLAVFNVSDNPGQYSDGTLKYRIYYHFFYYTHIANIYKYRRVAIANGPIVEVVESERARMQSARTTTFND